MYTCTCVTPFLLILSVLVQLLTAVFNVVGQQDMLTIFTVNVGLYGEQLWCQMVLSAVAQLSITSARNSCV